MLEVSDGAPCDRDVDTEDCLGAMDGRFGCAGDGDGAALLSLFGTLDLLSPFSTTGEPFLLREMKRPSFNL